MRDDTLYEDGEELFVRVIKSTLSFVHIYMILPIKSKTDYGCFICDPSKLDMDHVISKIISKSGREIIDPRQVMVCKLEEVSNVYDELIHGMSRVIMQTIKNCSDTFYLGCHVGMAITHLREEDDEE